MADVVDIKKKTNSTTTNEVSRIDLHDSAPDFVNSKTISVNTAPGVTITYNPGDNAIRLEKKGKIHYMPITNAKLIWMK